MLLQQGVRVESRRGHGANSTRGPSGRQVGRDAWGSGCSYPGPVRARVVGVLLLAAVVGVGGGLVAGWGVGQLDQTEAAAGGTASPLPASSPSVPVDPPPTVEPYADDIDYPPLQPGLALARQPMGNSVQAWVVPYPKGWQAFTVPGEVEVPRKERSTLRRAPLPPARRADPGWLQPPCEDGERPRHAGHDGGGAHPVGHQGVRRRRRRLQPHGGLGQVRVPRRQQPAPLQLLPVVRGARLVGGLAGDVGGRPHGR